MLARLRAPTPASLSFAKPRSELRNENLEDEEFHLDEVCPNPTLA